jgi:hypothetical protein
VNAEEMLDQLNIEGAECGSHFNDGDLMGWFSWSVGTSDDGEPILTVEIEAERGDKVLTNMHSWRLVPIS